MEIEELINQGLKGDEKAINHLYNTYSHKMVGICVKIVGNRMVAEELAHDAFILAISKLNQLQNPRRFEAWISCITSNVARRYLEQNRNAQTIPLSELPDDICLDSEAENPVRALPPFEVLMAAINDLPKGYGKVFKMSVIQDMTHAEIADILGIAAHSSSSQLARAKKMLRKMLANYWSLIVLLLISLPFAYLFIRQPQEETNTIAHSTPSPKGKGSSISKDLDTTTLPIDTIKATIPVSIKTNDLKIAKRYRSTPKNDAEQGCFANPIATTIVDSSLFIANNTIDSVAFDSISIPDLDPQTFLAQQEVEPIISKIDNSSWNVNMSYVGNIYSTSPRNVQDYFDDHLATGGVDNIDSNRWTGILSYANNANLSDGERAAIKEIAKYHIQQGEKTANRYDSHYLPFTISVAAQHRFNNHLGIESGLNYTLLSSQFVLGEINAGIVDNQKIHYLGIPLKVSYNWLSSKHWDIYSSAGFTFEFPVNATLSTDYRLKKSLYFKTESFKAPCQWSMSAGAGVQYNIGSHFGIFAEPNVQYFIPNGSDIKTYRTEHPFSITLPIGIRCRW